MSIQMDRIERKWYEKGEAMQDAKSARNLRKYGMDKEEIAKILERDLTWVEELLDRTKTPVTDSLTGILKGEHDFDDDKEELYNSLKEGFEDLENGRTHSLEEAIEDLRNRRKAPSGEFAEQILKELIDEGYSGYELLDEFRIRQAKVRPAVEAMLEEAKNVANGNGEYMSYEEFVKEVAGDEDKEDATPNVETLAAMNEYYEMKAHPEKYKRYASLKDAPEIVNIETMDPIEYMGFQKGLAEGIAIGEYMKAKEMSVALANAGVDIAIIAESAKVSSEQVMEWIEEK